MSKYDINRDLLSACRENDVRLASVLIELGADIDKKDCQGISALAVSVFENNIEMTKILLDNNANVNISVMDGWTPLMLASANTEDIEMTKLLIENGANIDELDDDGNCALMYCFSEENKSFANLLIKNGANIDIADKNGNTPLMKAVQRGNIDFVKFIIEKGANVNTSDKEGFTPLMYVSINKIKLTEKINNEKNKNVAEKNYLLKIFDPMYKNQLDIAEILIKNGADINAKANDGITAYAIANATKNRKVVELLRKNKVNIKSTINSIEKSTFLDRILNIKIKEKDLSENLVTKRLRNISEEIFYVSLLDLKKEDYPYEFFEKAIKDGVEINFQNKNKESVLMIAVRDNDKKLVQLLLENGALLELEDDNENDVYDYAYNASNQEMIDILNQYKELRKINTNPKKLIKLLKNFTIDTPIKCTTHSWEGSCESCKEMDFDEFISKVQEQWDGIKNELKELSPNLHVKIEAFLFSKTQQEWCKATGLNLGWSNLSGLKEHCNNGGKPFEYVLKEPISLEEETLTTFKELVWKFKKKIEVRNDGDMLKSIFVNFRKKLKKDAIKLKICPSLEGVDFYTDVEKLKSALNLIFAGIIAKKSNSDIVEVKLRKPNPESVEIYIIHKNSFSNRTKEEMFKENNDGDFKEIKENLTNLCDWSVEDKFEEKSYRVTYLKSTSINEKEELDRDVEGFTHILRFYK